LIMRKRLLVLLTVTLALACLEPVATAAVKPGTVCKKVGQTSTSSGIKYTCIKSGKKLVWNKGVAIKKPAPVASPTPSATATPTPTATPTASAMPTPTKFEPWSTNIDSKMLSDEAQKSFLAWAQTRTGATKNHTQQIQENKNTNRINLLKKSDDLGAQLFSSYFKQGSTTVIGANEGWTLEQLAKNGWTVNKCSDQYMSGVELCLEGTKYQGYVITSDSFYDARNPGRDGAALLAHEYFHLVQANLIGSRDLFRTKSGDPQTAKAFPAWFAEGSAEFVGYSVGALSQNASYWEGRATALSYAPPGEATNRNSISDYEIRTCCGNGTPTYPYNIGHVATEYIVASVGFQKLLDIFVDFGKSNDFEKSFESVTGISKQAFYEKFDLIRTKVGLPAISWKLDGITNKKIGG
jgi:hypothetical protein